MDICADDDSNLVIGVGAGRYYVAQVDIPAITYIETVVEPEETGDTPAEDGDNMGRSNIEREAQPLNMADVVLTLWSVDDLRSNQ